MHYGHSAFGINKTGARFAMSEFLIESVWLCELLIFRSQANESNLWLSHLWKPVIINNDFIQLLGRQLLKDWNSLIISLRSLIILID